jgi:hypothetical protein
MPRILKRPMFSRGGTTKKNNGIMTGLVDRTEKNQGGRIGYAEGPTQAEIYADEYYDQLSKIQPPKPKFNLGEFGMNLASGKYAGDGFVSSLVGSGREPYSKFTAADDKRRELDYNTKMAAAKMGISKADAEAIAKAKALASKKKGSRLLTEEEKKLIPGVDMSKAYQVDLDLNKISQVTGTGDTLTNLERNLIAAGFVKGTKEFQEAVKLRTLGEGQIGFSGFQKAANVDKANIAANYALEGVDLLINIANIGTSDPLVFGLAGKTKGFGKKIFDEGSQIYNVVTQKATKTGNIDSSAYEYLQEGSYSGIQPIENALSIHIARNRNPTGRLMKDMIVDAKKDAKLQGLGGAKLVEERLPFIFKEFLDTAINQYTAAGKTTDEIAELVNPKIKEFNAAMNKLKGIKTVSTEEKKPKFELKFNKELGIYQNVEVGSVN